MKKFMLIVAVAASALLVDTQLASAGRRGGRGGCGGCGGGGCGYYGGGCGFGGCGMGGYGFGGHGMGYAMGCATCGSGGYAYGGQVYGGGTSFVMSGTTCVGGVCSIVGGGATLAQATPAGATLVVNLPADATLTIDDEPTVSTSANRVFVTPPLESGKEFHYTLKARVVRDGKAQTTTQKVAVRAGEVSRVELTIPAAGVAAQ